MSKKLTEKDRYENFYNMLISHESRSLIPDEIERLITIKKDVEERIEWLKEKLKKDKKIKKELDERIEKLREEESQGE